MNAGSTGGVNKSGLGNLTLTAVNSQTGEFRINEGIVALTGNGTLGNNNNAMTIRQGATLNLGSNVASVGAFNNNGTVSGNAGQVFTVGANNGTGTSYGVISGNLNVLKNGTGAQSWLGQSTYTGNTTINSTGLVTVNFLENGGVASGIGASGNAASNLVFSGTTGGLVYQGARPIAGTNLLTNVSVSSTTDRLFTMTGTGATLSSTVGNNNAIVWSNPGAIVNLTTGNSTLLFTGTSTGDNTFNPSLGDNGANLLSVNKTGAGQWNLGSSSNTYTGNTTITEGILALNNNGALPTNSALTIGAGTTAGILQMSGTFDRNIVPTATQGIGNVTLGGTGAGFAAHTTPLTVAFGGVGSPTALTWGLTSSQEMRMRF